MSICAARVDERMIHGQVAMVWTNVVGANRILVANDEVVKDDLKQLASNSAFALYNAL